MSRVYGNLWLDLQDQALLVGDMVESGEYTTGSIKRTKRYRDLLAGAVAAILGYQALVLTSARDLQSDALDRSARDLWKLVVIQDPTADFRRVQRGAFDIMSDYLAQGSPLWERINGLSGYGADKITEAILDSIKGGFNATRTAQAIRKAFSLPLSDSLRMTRTVTAWSYREANRLSYMANPQAVEGWIWYSALEPGRTCMSCVNLHGTFHPADEVQEDHHNGLCTSIPKVIGVDNPVTETGEEWFKAQGEQIQKQMMGNGKYEAWLDGNVSIGDMTRPYQDEVYGEMLREATLKELIDA